MTTVSEIMTTPVATAEADDTLLRAASIMVEKKIGCLVVRAGKGELGIITEQDFLKFLVNDRRDVMEVKVEEIMTTPIKTVTSEETIYQASNMMQKGNFRRLPVMENDKLVGIVTQTDLHVALRMDTIRALRVKLDELEMINQPEMGREQKIGELKKELDELQQAQTDLMSRE